MPSPVSSVLKPFSNRSQSVRRKLGNPTVRVRPGGTPTATDRGCYMYVDYPPTAIADARNAIQQINRSVTLPAFGSKPTGRRLLQVDAAATATCVGSSVAAAGAAIGGQNSLRFRILGSVPFLLNVPFLLIGPFLSIVPFLLIGPFTFLLIWAFI
jgi:hypothetical protein